MAFGDITPTSGESNGKEHGKSNEPRLLHLNSITETTPSAKAFRVPSARSVCLSAAASAKVVLLGFRDVARKCFED